MPLRIIYRFVFSFLLLIIFPSLVAQKYRFQHFGLQDGLPSLQIFDMDMDSTGNLWLATLSGSVKFDGKNFTTYTNESNILDHVMASVKVSPNQEPWFGLWKNKVASLANDSLTVYQYQTQLGAVMAILFDTQNNPVCFASTGVYRMRKHQPPQLLYAPESRKLYPFRAVLGQERTYFITNQSELYILDNDFRLFRRINLPMNARSLYFDKHTGNIWLGCFGKLFLSDNNGIITQEYQLKGIDSTEYINAIAVDKYGNMWFGAGDKALYFWRKGTPFQQALRIDKHNGLPEGKITDIIIRDNQVWVSTDGNGLYVLNGLGLSYLTYPDDLVERNVTAIKPYRNGILFSTDRKLYYYKPDTRYLELLTEIHPSLFINDIEVWGDSVFIVSNNDFYLYYQQKITSLSAEGIAPFDVFYEVMRSPSGDAVYFGGRNTFNRIKNKSVTSFKIKNGYFDVRNLLQLSDSVFMKGGQNFWMLLKLSDSDTLQKEAISSGYPLNNFITIHSMIQLPDGNIFVGGENYLYYLSVKSNTIDSVYPFLLKTHFNSAPATTLYYKNDTVYLVTRTELLAFSYSEFKQTHTFRWHEYLGNKNGFLGASIDNSFYIDSNGTMYLGTTECLMIYKPGEKYHAQPSKPFVSLHQVKLFNRPVAWRHYTDSVRDNIGFAPDFPYSDNNLSFYFNATSLTFGKDITYRYRLLGYDSVWSNATSSPYISYASLPPGNYTLQAQAGLNAVWSAPYSYAFRILPPFWQTTWFYIMVSVMIIFSVGGMFYYRTRQLKQKMKRQKQFTKAVIVEQEKERKRIAKDLHDSIGQQLLLIKNKASEHEEIAQMVKTTIEEVRSISRNIHPLHLEKFGLLKTLEHISEKLSETTGIFVTCELDFDNEKLTETQQITVYRMAQEIFNNIVKHAQATGVKVEAFINKLGQFVLIVKDNGVGFDEKEKINTAKSMGLNGLYERASLINGKLTIQSTPGKGTTITLLINIE